MYTNQIEKTDTNYQISQEEWAQINEFWYDFYYNYSFGNLTAAQMTTQEMIKDVLAMFDGRAQETLGIHSNETKGL